MGRKSTAQPRPVLNVPPRGIGPIVDPNDTSRDALKNLLLGMDTVWLEAECSRYEYFSDIDRNPSKAVLLHHLNSGCARFQQDRAFDSNFVGSPVPVDMLCREIEREILDEKQLHETMSLFFKEHSYTEGKLLGCGMCRIRSIGRFVVYSLGFCSAARRL